MRTIPHTMATQHPDNAHVPEWASGGIIGGEGEIDEAYLSYREIGCEEVMWDAEGKDVDMEVLRKLFAKYGDFFKEKAIGRDVFLTYRIPNPQAESIEKKSFSEVLESIPKLNDVYRAFYGEDVPFVEVILPLTSSADDMLRVYDYYRRVIGERGSIDIGGIEVAAWLGPIHPRSIEIIPLFEDMNALLSADRILMEYVRAVDPRYVRAFIARSDPALNYGMIPAVLLSKIALSSLIKVEEEAGIPIYPIMGAGSLPFRGHLSPDNIYHFLEEYSGLYTVTIQSAFRYDYEGPSRSVRALNGLLPYSSKAPMDGAAREGLVGIIGKLAHEYQLEVAAMAPLVNYASRYVPVRRTRRSHVGLFGYPRKVGGIELPRAIAFVAALYSIGIPPEVIGVHALSGLREEEYNLVSDYYMNLTRDLEAAAAYLNPGIIEELSDSASYGTLTERYGIWHTLPRLKEDISTLESLGVKIGPRTSEQKRHLNMSRNLLISLSSADERMARMEIEIMGMLRKSLG